MEYFLRRVIFLIGTLWVAVTVNFFIPRAMPGNPVETMMARFHERGTMSPSAMKAITVMLGISHGNIFQQYGEYLNHVVHFNFGVSYTYFPYSVTYMISHALPERPSGLDHQWGVWGWGYRSHTHDAPPRRTRGSNMT